MDLSLVMVHGYHSLMESAQKMRALHGLIIILLRLLAAVHIQCLTQVVVLIIRLEILGITLDLKLHGLMEVA